MLIEKLLQNHVIPAQTDLEFCKNLPGVIKGVVKLENKDRVFKNS